MTRCNLCDGEAVFCIKGQPECAYCEECAIDAFGDTGALVKLSDAARTEEEI